MRDGYPNKRVVNTQGGINIFLKTVTLSDKTTYNIWSAEIHKIFLLLYLRGRYNKNLQYRKYIILISPISPGRKWI